MYGIGTDGNPVNMDLWRFCYDIKTNGYALNDSATLNNVSYGGTNETAVNKVGYLGDISEDGSIEGTIPAYIKENEEWKPVTSLYKTFQANNDNSNLVKIKKAPKIPSTVTNLHLTFAYCENLESMPAIPGNVTDMVSTFFQCNNLVYAKPIPNKVENMRYTFYCCSKLTTAYDIPEKVTDLRGTFEGCSSLQKAPTIIGNVINMSNTFVGCTSLIEPPIIPETVESMHGTFRGCTNLKNPPVIPSNVKNIINTFNNCSNLQGILEINASINGSYVMTTTGEYIDYMRCLDGATTNPNITLKVTGQCSVLKEIVEEANNAQITLY